MSAFSATPSVARHRGPIVSRSYAFACSTSASISGGSGSTGSGCAPSRSIARRDLDDRVVGQVRDRAVVPHVHDLHVARPGVERRHERRRRVAVERAAPLLEELRLRVERRVLVELEQPRLDLHDLLGARLARPLLLEHAIREVVVVQVVAGDRTDLPDQVGRHVGLVGDQVDRRCRGSRGDDRRRRPAPCAPTSGGSARRARAARDRVRPRRASRTDAGSRSRRCTGPSAR